MLLRTFNLKLLGQIEHAASPNKAKDKYDFENSWLFKIKYWNKVKETKRIEINTKKTSLSFLGSKRNFNRTHIGKRLLKIINFSADGPWPKWNLLLSKPSSKKSRCRGIVTRIQLERKDFIACFLYQYFLEKEYQQFFYCILK